MRQFQAPDLFVTLLACLLVAAIVVLGVLLVDNPTLKTAVLVASGSPPTSVMILWWQFGQRIRLWGYRRYYRIFGPRCVISLSGVVPTCPDVESALLDKALGIAGRWRPGARSLLRNANRVVIEADYKTLTVDVLPDDVDESEEFDEFEDDDGLDAPGIEPQQYSRIHFQLRGYAGPLTRMDSLVSSEIASLMSQLLRGMGSSSGTPNFALRAEVAGVNPFMTFYLRDVPADRIKEFRLNITEERHGSRVVTTVMSSSIGVSAHDPVALVQAAKSYLASPALAHVD